jgi:hypothetical protein
MGTFYAHLQVHEVLSDLSLRDLFVIIRISTPERYPKKTYSASHSISRFQYRHFYTILNENISAPQRRNTGPDDANMRDLPHEEVLRKPRESRR